MEKLALKLVANLLGVDAGRLSVSRSKNPKAKPENRVIFWYESGTFTPDGGAPQRFMLWVGNGANLYAAVNSVRREGRRPLGGWAK